MAIKSLEELKALRNSLQQQVDLREKGEAPDAEMIEVLVGMGTCGIAAGARDSFNKILDVIAAKELRDIKVISVGCIGFCHMEPTVQVNIPGKEPVVYGKITEEIVEEFIDKVLLKREMMEENFLVESFKKVMKK
jgi:NADP-reducing hydrogenase subunit HndB